MIEKLLTWMFSWVFYYKDNMDECKCFKMKKQNIIKEEENLEKYSSIYKK